MGSAAGFICLPTAGTALTAKRSQTPVVSRTRAYLPTDDPQFLTRLSVAPLQKHLLANGR